MIKKVKETTKLEKHREVRHNIEKIISSFKG